MEKTSYSGNNSYLKYIHNLSREEFFNSDGKAYCGRQILFLGDSHGFGKYVLTGEDVINCARFKDSIARGCYDIDVHSPAGTGTVIKAIKGYYYTIPLRSIIPNGADNLAVAGRPISCDHEAHSSLRVLPIASSIGEAAGCAVTVAAKSKVTLDKIDYKDVQNMLTKYGAIF